MRSKTHKKAAASFTTTHWSKPASLTGYYPFINLIVNIRFAPTVAKLFSYYWFVALLPSLSRLRRFSFRKAKNPSSFRNWDFTQTGNVLFSRAASRQVSSALGSLTSVFEMGTGGSSPPLSPDHCLSFSPISERKILRNLFNLPFETKNRDQIFYLHSLSDYLPLIKLSID